MKRLVGIFSVSLLLLLVTGCTTIDRSQSVKLPPMTKVAVFPFANNTATVQASQRAVSMAAHLLTECRLQAVMYPARCDKSICQYSRMDKKKMRAWALRNGIHYALNGAVNEWRYKVGLDGEPAVSLGLSIIDLKNNHIIWSAVGSKAGGSRSSLGYTAQNLLTQMMNNVSW